MHDAQARPRAATAPAPAKPESGLLWPAAVVLAAAVTSTMSLSAVTTALPTMAADFDVSPATIAWVVIAQSLANATLLTVFGRLSDMTGRIRLYTAGLAISVVASALCGLSGTVGQLIGFRLLSGIGGAMIAANSLAYLLEIFPANRRGFLVGIFEAAIAVGLATGPPIGGVILSLLGWRAIFFVYVAVGVVLLLLVPRVLKERPRERGGERFDFTGAALFAGALAPMLYALMTGRRAGWLAPPTLFCLGVSLLSLIAFIAVERRVRQPMVQLAMFRSRGFSAGNLAKVCAYFAFSATTLLLPFYWDEVLRLSPARLGLALMAFPIGMLIGSVAFGPLSDRVGTRTLAPAGLVVLVLASLVETRLTGGMGVPPVLVAAFLAGLGLGAFIAPNDSAILAVTPPERLGVANGIMGVSRSLGLLFGQAASAELLTARLAANDGAFLPSYHEVFMLVAGIALVGVLVAVVRDPVPHPPERGGRAVAAPLR